MTKIDLKKIQGKNRTELYEYFKSVYLPEKHKG